MQNKKKEKLEDFSLHQLNILLKHLRLGQDHLKALLISQQLKELFHWCDLEIEQKQQIATDRIEKLGNMVLIINTILTSTFGAWMGLSGCIGYALGSFKMLAFISVIAFFVSTLIGYMSLKMTKSQARNAIQNQVLHQFQLRVLKTINQKIKQQENSLVFYLHTAIFILENNKIDGDEKNQSNLFENSSQAYQWYEKLLGVLNSRLKEVKDNASAEIYQKQIERVSFLIKKTLAKHTHFLESLAVAKQKENQRRQIMPILSFLNILTNPSFGIPKYRSLMPAPGIKKHFNQLLLGLVPTIWGGFASMFVFVGGIPTIAGDLNFVWLKSLLISPSARIIEISLAGLVTCYFAFAFFYSFRKSWQREQLLEQIEKKISNEETRLLENNHKLDMLFKIKMYTQKLISNFTVVKKIDQKLMSQDRSLIYPSSEIMNLSHYSNEIGS